MKKLPTKRLQNIYRVIAYTSIVAVFALEFYLFTVPSIVQKRVVTFPQVQRRYDPINATVATSPRPPSPTPEAFMRNQTYTSKKLKISFTYATKIKSGRTTSSLTATEIGNRIYIHEIGKSPTLKSNHYLEILDKDPRLNLEKAVKFLYMTKPQYCEVHVYKETENHHLPDMRFNITEIARINVSNPLRKEGEQFDYDKDQQWNNDCGHTKGFFAYDQGYPDKLLFFTGWAQYGDYIGTNGSNPLYSNVIENDRNLSWYETFHFVK